MHSSYFWDITARICRRWKATGYLQAWCISGVSRLVPLKWFSQPFKILFCNNIKQICAVNSKDRFLPQGVNLVVETQGQFTVYALSGDRLLTHPKQWCPSRSPEEAKTGSMLDKSLYLFSARFHLHTWQQYGPSLGHKNGLTLALLLDWSLRRIFNDAFVPVSGLWNWVNME